MRALVDIKGEAFAYIERGILYTLEGEASGRLEKNLIVDNAGNPMWRVYGDGVYTLDGFQNVGYLSSERNF